MSNALTPAFRAWFGDSKVVGADGLPLVVYHGTNSDFDAFEAGDGFTSYFAFDAKIAAEHAENVAAEKGGAACVMPVCLSIKNPAILDGDESSHIGYSPGEIGRLIEMGHDGIISADRYELIVFSPAQIKSAIGNCGRYDPCSPSILD